MAIHMNSRYERARVSFRGDRFQFVKQSILNSVPAILLMSILMMDIHFFRLFFIGLVLMVLLAFLFSLISWFALDDTKERIRRAFRVTIPYKSVRAIYIDETSKILNITYKGKLFIRANIINGLRIGEKNRVIEELARRFPQEIIHTTRYHNLKRELVILVIIIIIWSLFLLYMNKKYSIHSLEVETFHVNLPDKQLERSRRYNFGGFSFSLHPDLSLSKRGEGNIAFKDDKNGSTVSVEGRLFPDSKLMTIIGMKDSYDWLQMAKDARIGGIPLFVKFLLAAITADEKLYDFQRETVRGIIIKGTKRAILLLLVSNKKTGEEITFSIDSRTTDETLQMVMNSISITGT
jgi:hypothetical protein